MSEPVLNLSGIFKSFMNVRRGPRERVLRGINLTLHYGDSIAIVGESGCGKTTLARIMALATAPDDGEVWLDGRLMTPRRVARNPALRRRVQLVFQDHEAAFNPFWRFDRALRVPLRYLPKKDRRDRLEKALRDVGLHTSILDRFVNEVSGGQRQRLNIARAISVAPGILIADEPTAALDSSLQAKIINLFARLQRADSMILVVVTHSLATVTYMCQDIAVMYLGQIVETGQSRSVLAAPMHPYTRLLKDAIPRIDATEQKNEPIQDDRLETSVAACDFYQRCPRRQTLCANVAPKLTKVVSEDDRHVSCHFPHDAD